MLGRRGESAPCRVLLELVEERRLRPAGVDWLVVHYSSHFFRDRVVRAGAPGADSRFRASGGSRICYTKGNVGLGFDLRAAGRAARTAERSNRASSVFCMVPGERTIPVRLHAADGRGRHAGATSREAGRASAMPRTRAAAARSRRAIRWRSRWCASSPQVWFDFDDRLRQRARSSRSCTTADSRLEDYKALLFNIRQQVIDGSRWIARAASSITAEYFPIRSAFIAHTQRRAPRLRDARAQLCGRRRRCSTKSARGRKNIGSEALSRLHAAAGPARRIRST